MKTKKLIILVVTLIIAGIFGNLNVVVSETNENLVSIETDTNIWNFNSSWDTWECNNYSAGKADSGSYVNSTIGYIYGQPKMNETGCGQAKGWMIHSVEWDCPVNNESGVINISYEYGAFAFLWVNSSGYAYAKLWLTFFIDDIQHEVIIYNNTIDELNESVNFSSDSIENWSKNLTLSNKTYIIGVNASFEIEYTGNDTQSIAWLSINISDTTTEEDDGYTEYWAVLIGVDYRWNQPKARDRIPFDEMVEEMHKMLLVSNHWQEDHIKVLTNEKATWSNIIEALLWLDSKDDEDDVSLVYYSAHGGKVGYDIPPKDEEDGNDEYLTTYYSNNWFAGIWDDLFNFLLDKLDSGEVAVIIDACFSGGMIDEDESTWITEFSGEISQDGKVVVTCCEEEEEGIIDDLDGKSFTYFIADGLQGYADQLSEYGNLNGFVSIEEAFNYAAWRYKYLSQFACDPVIYDSDIDNELELTDVEFPPNAPILSGGDVTVGQPFISYDFYASSTDPTHNNIIYGWNWSKDRSYERSTYILWYFGCSRWGGYDVEDWSASYPSGDTCTMSHSWDEPGVYAVRAKAQDEHGAELIENLEYSRLWSRPKYLLINAEDEIVDQYHLMSSNSYRLWNPLAQSFKPSSSYLSKIKLKLALFIDYVVFSDEPYFDDYFINVYIRDNLSGENLAFASKRVSIELKEIKSKTDWVEFNFPVINVIPNEQYFIVLEIYHNFPPDSIIHYYDWVGNGDGGYDQYARGEAYYRNPDSGEWIPINFFYDFCFITYEPWPVDAGGPYYALLDEQPVEFNGSAYGNPPYNWSWDFGDGNGSTLEDPAYTYESIGNYTVKLTVTDSENVTTNDTTWTNIRDFNNPPYAPNKPSGPAICRVGKYYDYSTITADPDGDSMYYKWDWGDGTYSEWLGPVNSGQTHITCHSWSQWGLYKIRVKAKDVYGGESGWSDKLWVYIRLLSDFSVSPSFYSQSSQAVYFNDCSQSYYEIVNWIWDFGDGNFSYAQNTSHIYAADGVYNVTLTVTDGMSASNVSYQLVYIDSIQPEIINIFNNPDTVGFGFNVTIATDVADNQSGVETVTVNITYPDSTTGNFSMNNTGNDTYQYVFSDTWLVGQYNYTIWTADYVGNGNSSTGHSFNVSAQATISVCTIKDSYGGNETINLTDPPGDPTLIGYELMDDGKVLRIWNNYDSYYFNTTSGIQLTNHYNKYWSHNVLMLGYYNNNQWHLVYRTDELSGFNKNIESDNETFVNATLWKDLVYQGYDFRLAIRYHLGVDDKQLTVIPYIKNLGQAIPYTLGFAWELKDIQVDMTPGGDYLEINGTTYYLNQSLDETYKNMNRSCFYIREDISSDRSESLYLCWNDSLDYFVKVKSRDGQYNAPVTLGIKIGTLGVGQEKYTSLFWHDASQITYYFNSHSIGETWTTNPSYMVDSSTSTYASTTSNGDVELCNGNTCSGLYLGEIIKVELRVYGYYTNTQRDITLRPVFDAITDGGGHYIYLTTTTPSWSQWFDITTDPLFTPPWSWTKVKNLDCDAEAESGFGVFTLYCSKVEIRVTYIPNNNPVISNPYPADGSTGISIAPVLNITVSDPDGYSMNITWLSNSSGSWQVFGTNNSVGNGTYHQIISNASVNGQWWYWKVNVTDGTNYTVSSVYKFYTGYQSKINNTGSYHFKGYLLIQVQYYNVSSQSWIVADDTVNETSPRTILWADPSGTPGQNILALDTIFNGLVSTSDLSGYGNGTYRVYACFRDPDGNVLVCDDNSLMEATYEFTVNL